MATIKPIEHKSVHQIQSGQVIVDLTSVVKELVENSLDAGASKIDVRFKNHGIDLVEVQDDGNGIAPEDFTTVALKHHTSKLSSFEDLDTLETFGFRGEALSSLCALADVHITTARAQDGAVGRRLDFEISGKLKSTTIVSAQKGTTVSIENIFHNLPVRKKELERNAKREWTKVLNFMYSYACIGIGIRFSLSNQPLKGKKSTAFSTKGNPTTRENIANVFGAKTMTALVKLDLTLTMQSLGVRRLNSSTESRLVRVEGHISKPGWGEGRQTPDRQMYFVNSRPCLLPQVSKVFNEVYKSYNHHQSPFVLANFLMDTNSYDVNVSPDKKTIMLHDQTALLEQLKESLSELFLSTDHTLPQTQLPATKLPAYKLLSGAADSRARSRAGSTDSTSSLIEDWAARDSTNRKEKNKQKGTGDECANEQRVFNGPAFSADVEATTTVDNDDELLLEDDITADAHHTIDSDQSSMQIDSAANNNTRSKPILEPLLRHSNAAGIDPTSTLYDDVFLRSPPRSTLTKAMSNSQTAPQGLVSTQRHRKDVSSTQARSNQQTRRDVDEEAIPSTFNSLPKVSAGPINDAFARMRRRRTSPDDTEITIDDAPITTTAEKTWKRRRIHTFRSQGEDHAGPIGSQSLLSFAAPGSLLALSTAGSVELTDAIQSDADDDPGEESTPLLSWPVSTIPRSTSIDGVSEQPIDPDEEDFENEGEKKRHEDEVVAQLIQDAEMKPAQRRFGTQRSFLGSDKGKQKDFTNNLACSVSTSIEQLQQSSVYYNIHRQGFAPVLRRQDTEDYDPETKLSLTVNKSDFDRMKVVGQFNLGFILAVRPSSSEQTQDELFIIDQHAADEKFNYERLQRTVVLQSQPLVQPKLLELTAVEEEVVFTHPDALKANGFEVDVSERDDSRVYRLLTLPTSHNTTFKLSDLEELMHLLSELSVESSEIPRPRKVQKMLAMRACRSSIMVGKTLTTKQMCQVVQHMGGMEKPWNCPHGRPTMRHLTGLSSWHSWREGENTDEDAEDRVANWKAWM